MPNQSIPTVVITYISPRWRIFQHFLLGFYQLERAGKIRLKFRCDWFFRISTILPDLPHWGGVMHQLAVHFLPDSYNMEGYVEQDGQRKTFCIDSADSPYCMDGEALQRTDIYFKMQCPIEIDEVKGFRLSDEVYIPYCDHKHVDTSIPLTGKGKRQELPCLKDNKHKIHPTAFGFRRLADGNSYRALNNGYENYRKGAQHAATKKLMCYFGNALGPRLEKEMPEVDWDMDSHIMTHYAGKLHHPNEKRAKVAEIIGSLGEGYDARVISQQNTGTRHLEKREDLIVPIEDFCAHISQFQYNCNVSGLRLSTPSRFAESFIVGTAIVTDKLAVKWYLPFDEEVIETEEMGYIPEEQVDWDKVRHDLSTLPDIDKQTVLKRYEEKWAPSVVAEYMIKATLNA